MIVRASMPAKGQIGGLTIDGPTVPNYATSRRDFRAGYDFLLRHYTAIIHEGSTFMTTIPLAFPTSRLLHRLILIGATLFPGSCSALTPSCSDERVSAMVKELVLQRLQENYGLTAMYDLQATRFDLRAIRTVASDDRQSTCRTDLAMELELNSELKASMAKPSSNPTEAQMMKSMLGNNSRSVDLRYTVEITDDRKDLYVTIQRF